MPRETVQEPQKRTEPDHTMLDKEVEELVRLQVYQSMHELRMFIERGGKR